jgi:hypothetical protein
MDVSLYRNSLSGWSFPDVASRTPAISKACSVRGPVDLSQMKYWPRTKTRVSSGFVRAYPVFTYIVQVAGVVKFFSALQEIASMC